MASLSLFSGALNVMAGHTGNAPNVVSNSVVHAIAHALLTAGGVFAISGSDLNRMRIWQYKI
jgi:hypothetical protein